MVYDYRDDCITIVYSIDESAGKVQIGLRRLQYIGIKLSHTKIKEGFQLKTPITYYINLKKN